VKIIVCISRFPRRTRRWRLPETGSGNRTSVRNERAGSYALEEALG